MPAVALSPPRSAHATARARIDRRRHAGRAARAQDALFALIDLDGARAVRHAHLAARDAHARELVGGGEIELRTDNLHRARGRGERRVGAVLHVLDVREQLARGEAEAARDLGVEAELGAVVERELGAVREGETHARARVGADGATRRHDAIGLCLGEAAARRAHRDARARITAGRTHDLEHARRGGLGARDDGLLGAAPARTGCTEHRAE
jgi:hypothetical protein